MNRSQFNLEQDEELILEAMLHGRKIQEYLWQELSLSTAQQYDPAQWKKVFQKRIDKIEQLDPTNPSSKVELRKRILQQATLSIIALKILDNELEAEDGSLSVGDDVEDRMSRIRKRLEGNALEGTLAEDVRNAMY